MLSANTEHFALMFTASLCIKHNEHQKCVRDVAIMGLCVGQGVTSVPGGAGCCCQFVGLALVIGPEGSRTWQLLYIKACVRSLTWRLYCVAIQLVFKT